MPTNKGIDEILTPLQQRIFAIVLLLFVLLLLYLLVLMPLIRMTVEQYEQEHNLVFKLQKYEEVIAAKDAVIASINDIEQENAAQRYFNNQETEALASATMQELLKKTIQDAGGQLRSTQVIASDITDNNSSKFIHVTVKVDMVVNSTILRTVLYNIENSMPLMIINQMEIKQIPNTNNEGKITASNQLDVDFQVVSFMRNPSQ